MPMNVYLRKKYPIKMFDLATVLNSKTNLSLLGIVHGRKVCKSHESESIRGCFLALFISAGSFIYEFA